MRQVLSVLAIPVFRRLWVSAFLCCVGDWLSLLALSGIFSQWTKSFEAHTFALSGVVVTQLLPGLVLAPVAGVLVDRIDRRLLMVFCDMLRCGLFLSVIVIGTPWWLFIANFLVGCCSLAWVLAKDSLVPNLVRGAEQLEAASQLNVVSTYGIALLTGCGLYSALTGLFATQGGIDIAYLVVVLNGMLYLMSAIVIWLGIPKTFTLPERTVREVTKFSLMLRTGLHFVRITPLIRGLAIGITGAMIAAGTLISICRSYLDSLRIDEAGLGILVIAVAAGVMVGVTAMPGLTRWVPRERLFGIAVIAGGCALLLFACARTFWLALVAAFCLGSCAGSAFLLAVTVIGSSVQSGLRGRTNAVVQSLVKVVLFATTILVPQVVGFSGDPNVSRVVVSVAAIACLVGGVLARRDMAGRELSESSGKMTTMRPAEHAGAVNRP